MKRVVWCVLGVGLAAGVVGACGTALAPPTPTDDVAAMASASAGPTAPPTTAPTATTIPKTAISMSMTADACTLDVLPSSLQAPAHLAIAVHNRTDDQADVNLLRVGSSYPDLLEQVGSAADAIASGAEPEWPPLAGVAWQTDIVVEPQATAELAYFVAYPDAYALMCFPVGTEDEY